MNPVLKEIIEWIYCFIVAIGLALVIRYYLVTPTVVKQSSMYPTLQNNERLILSRTFRISGLKLDYEDIITFEAPTRMYTSEDEISQSTPFAIYDEQEKNAFLEFLYNVVDVGKMSYIKRVVGLPGDHIVIEEGKVYRNGVLLEERYLPEGTVTYSKIFYDIIVPENTVFALGDNRSGSGDCRHFGCIPFEKIEGIVEFRFWPFNKMGAVE